MEELAGGGGSSLSIQRPYEHHIQTTYPCPHCAKEYTSSHHLATHQRSSCASSKRKLSELLEDTRTHWERKKRARLEQQPQDPNHHGNTSGSSPAAQGSQNIHDPTQSTLFAAPDVVYDDLDVPLSRRKFKRERQLPARYRQDDLPAPPLKPRQKAQPAPRRRDVPTPEAPLLVVHESEKNRFGVLKRYLLREGIELVHDPDQHLRLSNVPSDRRPAPGKTVEQTPFGPFTHKTAFLLAEWYWNSKNKSFADFQKLISVLADPEFSLDHALSVNWKNAFRLLGASKDEVSEDEASWMTDDGWKTDSISLDVPIHKQLKDSGTKSHTVGEFRHRTIVSVIKERLSSPTGSRTFHYYPYQATWKRTSDSPEVELYGELYASRAFREAHEALQRQPPTSRDKGHERVVVALMFWSDGMQLTSFGGADLWPCYLFFGNDSKHERGKPSEQLGYQLAYFLKLPDSFNDYLRGRNGGKLPSANLIKYCRRQLFHKQWSILLDEEFLDAMKHGIAMACPDGETRCFFPRIFSYGADYPEKILIGRIRNYGLCPCHRCFVGKTQLFKLGSPLDTERVVDQRNPVDQKKYISEAQGYIRSGYAVDTDAIEDKLKPRSLVPVKSAFDPLLTGFGFDILSALTVDILHEFEIGVWKRLYIHLIRLLEAFTSRKTITLTAELDSRYRKTPPFGKDTIRKFPLNASDMKRKAARDFEDLLQCAIPCFELLLPEPYNGEIMSLLFVCAQWHALAKLRLHNDFTLGLLEYTTAHLGAQMRSFSHSCSKIPTKELKKEAEARARKAANQNNGSGEAESLSAAQRPAQLSIFTIKFHFLGDYASNIRRLGTTDSYSTQTGELYHREPKSWYPRTDKKHYEVQLSQIERRKSRLAQIRAAQIDSRGPRITPTPGALGTVEASTDSRYSIAASQNCPISLQFFAACGDDPGDDYAPGFIPSLKQHLLGRILARMDCSPDALDATYPWTHVVLQGNRVYSHKILRTNFTTYDVRRDQDIIHIDTPQCNVMLLNPKYKEKTRRTTHPYLYGKVLGIYHANVSYAGPLPVNVKKDGFLRVDFVWIHWYDHLGSQGEFSLDRVSLSPLDTTVALGFVDPADVIRATHLIPQFSNGAAPGRHSRSQLVSDQDRWGAYYINRFVDRDMYMRYQYGMSIGHTYTHTAPFPPPQVPLLPPGFDHHIPPEKSENLAGNSKKAENDGRGNKPKKKGVRGGTRGRASGDEADGGENCEGRDGCDGCEEREGYQGRKECEAREGCEEDEEEEESDGDEEEDGEEGDYLDELDDQEFTVYDDMFGCDEY